MKNAWKWLIVFAVVFVVVLIIALLFSFGSGYGYGWMPMMGNRGFSNFNGFGLIGGVMMLFMLFIPLVLIGLAVFGVVALLQRSGNILTQPQMPACSNCGKPLQAGWNVCPNCGTKVK
jgi:hypothetical protein